MLEPHTPHMPPSHTGKSAAWADTQLVTRDQLQPRSFFAAVSNTAGVDRPLGLFVHAVPPTDVR